MGHARGFCLQANLENEVYFSLGLGRSNIIIIIEETMETRSQPE